MSVQSIRSASLLAALVLGAATFPSSLSAQQGATDDRGSAAAQVSTSVTPAPVVAAHPTSALGPRIAPAGITRPVAANVPDPARPYDARMGAGSNVALMGAGAAAVVVGLLIGGEGGTMLALGGGVIGLVGLYRYVR